MYILSSKWYFLYIIFEFFYQSQEVVGEVQSSRETAVAAVKKEQKATALVAELTAMIKEQKTRINGLNRNKQETVANLKVSWMHIQ